MDFQQSLEEVKSWNLDYTEEQIISGVIMIIYDEEEFEKTKPGHILRVYDDFFHDYIPEGLHVSEDIKITNFGLFTLDEDENNIFNPDIDFHNLFIRDEKTYLSDDIDDFATYMLTILGDTSEFEQYENKDIVRIVDEIISCVESMIYVSGTTDCKPISLPKFGSFTPIIDKTVKEISYRIQTVDFRFEHDYLDNRKERSQVEHYGEIY